MITIVYSTHKDLNYNKSFKEHLNKSIGIKNFEILEYENFNQYSLSEIYNRGIIESKNDIIVCLHNDIKLETGWGKKLLKNFSDNSEYGIIGKAGSCYFPESGVYWERMQQTMVGQVYHQPEGQKKWLSKYSSKLPFLIPVVTIDGLFISFDKNKIKHRFDESIGRFHFYDHLFCVPNFIDGVKIGVTSSFEITHESVGQPNDEFFTSKDQFLNKWSHVLPLDLKPKSVYVPEIKEKPMKQDGKVAIIIPTKGKVKMLFDCVKSFYNHCNHELFKIFIADTGSTDEEKEWIKQNILGLGDIKLIEYDYYNFAKINNDVVKNHVTDEFKYILFSNNDIKVLNNVIYDMLLIFKTNKNTGTVGCRLHFEDNTIQHHGILLFYNKENKLQITHSDLGSYYNSNNGNSEVIGNTGALLMIKKIIFEKCGLFNVNYNECFEDLELNLQCILLGFKNYMSPRSVAYHYESKTRNENENKIQNEVNDYQNTLFSFINNNINKLQSKILMLK
jgi:GT2 family glycosyltransferase